MEYEEAIEPFQLWHLLEKRSSRWLAFHKRVSRRIGYHSSGRSQLIHGRHQIITRNNLMQVYFYIYFHEI